MSKSDHALKSLLAKSSEGWFEGVGAVGRATLGWMQGRSLLHFQGSLKYEIFPAPDIMSLSLSNPGKLYLWFIKISLSQLMQGTS